MILPCQVGVIVQHSLGKQTYFLGNSAYFVDQFFEPAGGAKCADPSGLR